MTAAITKWLLECAGYFETRPTDGEDKAHWANALNAENARKAAFARAGRITRTPAHRRMETPDDPA